MSKITEKVAQIARPVIEENGCELWDVEYVREAGAWYLRIYIDKEGGVGISDCEKISRAIDPILDEADPIQDSYIFEVGSAGCERELKRPSDFEKFTGSQVEIKFYQPIDGGKTAIGSLVGYEDGSVTIQTAAGEKTYTKQQIAQVKLHMTI